MRQHSGIGAMGMPGGLGGFCPKKLTSNEMRIARLGDSQRGRCLCFPIRTNLHQRIDESSRSCGAKSLSVLPMARSGDDLSDWLSKPARSNRAKKGVFFFGDTHLLLDCRVLLLQSISSDVIDDAIANRHHVVICLRSLELRNRLVEAYVRLSLIQESGG